MQPLEAGIHEQALSIVQNRMGESVISAIWLEGSRLGPAEAVAYALSSNADMARPVDATDRRERGAT
jgi:hypothetical protein